MDCDGHGTHIAGIIGGDARNASAPQAFVGVAPAVEFGAYKVLPCGGKASDDDIMKVCCFRSKTSDEPWFPH